MVLLLFFLVGASSDCYAELPVCSNRIIREVTTRVGCTLGEAQCWLTMGGFCTDYIQKMANNRSTSKEFTLSNKIRPEDVRKGDIAQFNSWAHYAYIENVVKDKNGKPTAIDVSEYNYGTCWVDRATMVTDKYKTVNRRFGIPVTSVDGGFWRY